MIHHYTSLDTLALILKSRRIRFNRLDRVDDVNEEAAFGDVNLAKYLFVSCWTNEEAESIPQWNMYTPGMRGVRISLPRPPFRFRPVDPSGYPIEVRGVGKTPIPFDQLITADYFILPTFVHDFEGEVEYLEDLKAKYREAVRLTVASDGQASLRIDSIFALGRFKSKRWSFQKEVRYSLFIMPSSPLPASGVSDPNHYEAVVKGFLQNVVSGVAPRITYFDVELAPEAIQSIVVTLGPCANHGDRVIAECLLHRYAAGGNLRLSELTGQIRDPLR